MTKKIENTPTSRIRIREFLEENGIPLSAAEKVCGFANGFMSAGGEMGTDKLRVFIENYPNADLYYIVMGVKSDSSCNNELMSLCRELVGTYQQQNDLMKKLVSLV